MRLVRKAQERIPEIKELESGFIEVEITEAMYERARKKAEDQQVTARTIHDYGREIGYLGEEIFWKAFPEAKRINDFDKDFMYRGYKIDVKSKWTKVVPKLDYEGTIYQYHLDADTDLFVHVRVFSDYKKGWICGFISKDETIEANRKIDAGTMTSNGRTFHADALNVFYSQCRKPMELKKLEQKS